MPPTYPVGLEMADNQTMNVGEHARDRGASLIGYALIVALVGIVASLSLMNVGENTSEAFSEVAVAAGDEEGETTTTTTAPLTPKEKWDQAKKDYNDAMAEAKSNYQADIAAAKNQYKADLTANKSLPKAEKKAANKTAKNNFTAAKQDAKGKYNAAKSAAASAKSAAKAEYNATK